MNPVSKKEIIKGIDITNTVHLGVAVTVATLKLGTKKVFVKLIVL